VTPEDAGRVNPGHGQEFHRCVLSKKVVLVEKVKIDKNLLARAAQWLRCPHWGASEMALRDAGISCGCCGHCVKEQNGYLDFLDAPLQQLSLAQRMYIWKPIADLYARLRSSPEFPGNTWAEEVSLVIGPLQLKPDARVLDVAYGQGNFTRAIAAQAPDGLVFAVDLSPAQLELSRQWMERSGFRNILLIRASALDLPLCDDSVEATLDSGGLHLYPDVGRAITEKQRVLVPGGKATGLTFLATYSKISGRVKKALLRILGLRAFDFNELGKQFTAAGFQGWSWKVHLPMAYYATQKRST
jgi:SAM-dependent methyltransferase